MKRNKSERKRASLNAFSLGLCNIEWNISKFQIRRCGTPLNSFWKKMPPLNYFWKKNARNCLKQMIIFNSSSYHQPWGGRGFLSFLPTKGQTPSSTIVIPIVWLTKKPEKNRKMMQYSYCLLCAVREKIRLVSVSFTEWTLTENDWST